jgi:hypothetical protein
MLLHAFFGQAASRKFAENSTDIEMARHPWPGEELTIRPISVALGVKITPPAGAGGVVGANLGCYFPLVTPTLCGLYREPFEQEARAVLFEGRRHERS